jgi:hypothetical protein
MKCGFLALLALLAVPALSQTPQPKPEFFTGLKDLSIYLKPRFNTPNLWDQQVGVRAKIVRYGNLSSEFSIAYDPYYPIKWDIKPKWTSGIQVAYFFAKDPFPIGVYTTPKYNLVNGWKQEAGFNFRFISKPQYYVNSSVDYQIPYPYAEKSKPTFQGSLTIGFPLGGFPLGR